MAELKLLVKVREQASKDLYKARQRGMIPSVMYGHGSAPQMFWVQYLDFSKLYKKAGESSIVEIVPEEGKAMNVIINDVQLNPLSNRFAHIDFFQVRMDEKLEAHIPVEEILVSCLPKDLPHSFAVDLSVLRTFERHIQIKDIKLPAGVEVLTDSDTVIALVEAPRTEAEMAALDEKVEADVTKVEGVVKEAPAGEEVPAKSSEEKK
jgi:large subunit ribosomal protein L25